MGRGKIVHLWQTPIDKTQLADLIPGTVQEIILDWVCFSRTSSKIGGWVTKESHGV